MTGINYFQPEWRVSADLVNYPEAREVMEARVDAIIEGRQPEMIWLLQHPPLYTAGTSADRAELKDAARFPVYEAGRGGRYTYHGPGQRVVYAMIDLRTRGKDVRQHVWRLEEWMIRVLADFGVVGERREGRVGIWVRRMVQPSTLNSPLPHPSPRGGGENFIEEKIGAIGVRVRKWVAYHGLALNVDPDMSHFSGIVPCGIAEYGVTSLRKLGLTATMAEIDAAFKTHLDVLVK